MILRFSSTIPALPAGSLIPLEAESLTPARVAAFELTKAERIRLNSEQEHFFEIPAAVRAGGVGRPLTVWRRRCIEVPGELAVCTVVRSYTQGMEGLTTAKLAKEGGVTVETIRYYERHGLLPRPPRTASGYRKFSADYVIRLRFIRHAQELGFTLKEVKELLNLPVKPGSSCADVRRKAQAKIAGVDEKIRHLRAIREALVTMTETCTGRGPLTNCSILEALHGQGRF